MTGLVSSCCLGPRVPPVSVVMGGGKHTRESSDKYNIKALVYYYVHVDETRLGTKANTWTDGRTDATLICTTMTFCFPFF